MPPRGKKIRQVGLVAFNGTTELSTAGSRDMFSAANMSLYRSQFNTSISPTEILKSVRVVTHDGMDVTSFSGAKIKSDAAVSIEDEYDLVVISGFWGDIRSILKDNQNLLQWLKVQNEKGAIIACFHAGAYVLAEAGLLDGKVATLYWRLVDDFKSKYKKVILMPEKTITVAGNIYCSSGISSAIELASYLIEKLWSFDIAQKVARSFLMDVPRNNQDFNLQLSKEKQHNDEKIIAAQNWIETYFSSEFLMEELADKMGLSLRNLARRFKQATGDTPSQYLQKVRVEVAKDLLTTTDMSVDQITYHVGYFDVSSFCRLFKKITGNTPSEFRATANQFN